jgi:hypothetical protein
MFEEGVFIFFNPTSQHISNDVHFNGAVSEIIMDQYFLLRGDSWITLVHVFYKMKLYTPSRVMT